MSKTELYFVVCVEGSLLLLAAFCTAKGFYDGDSLFWSIIFALATVYIAAAFEMTCDRIRKFHKQ